MKLYTQPKSHYVCWLISRNFREQNAFTLNGNQLDDPRVIPITAHTITVMGK